MKIFLKAAKRIIYSRYLNKICNVFLFTLAVHSVLMHYNTGGYLELQPILDIVIIKPFVDWLIP